MTDDFKGDWGRSPGIVRIPIGLERLNGLSLQEVKEDMRVIT